MLKKLHVIKLLLISILLLLSGCGGMTTIQSTKTSSSLANEIKELNVIYQHNELHSITPSDKVDVKNDNSIGYGEFAKVIKDIEYTGYNDLPKLLQERTPLVFGLNHISTKFASTNSANSTQKTQFDTLKPNESSHAPVLLIQAVNAKASFNSYGGSVLINMQANLYDATRKIDYWTINFENAIYYGGFGLSGHIDSGYVDKMLKTIIEQMSKDKLINLPDNKALLPEK